VALVDASRRVAGTDELGPAKPSTQEEGRRRPDGSAAETRE
jgi:hypothetical protein